MSEFTLYSVLNSIKKNLLITAIIFIASYLLLPSSNILDNRYSMQKTINLGEYTPGHQFDFLNYSQMHAILTSANTRFFLANNIDVDVAQFELKQSKEKTIMIVFKNHNREGIIKTADLIMKRLQEYDEIQIQKRIALIDVEINDQRNMLQTISLPIEEFYPSNEDIKRFVNMQKIYDAAYDSGSIGKSNFDIDKMASLKRDEVSNKMSLEQTKIKINSRIEQLNEVKKNGLKTISFLFPLSDKEITQYYPNQMIFFSISLILALLYNLIILNIFYIKHTKSKLV